MSRLIMHSDVNVARFILIGFLLILTFTSTHQDEIKSNWNKQLYPTNSVYETSLTPHVQGTSLKKNIVLPNASPESYEDTLKGIGDASDEGDYDDYEADGTQEATREVLPFREHRNSSEEIHYKTQEEENRESPAYYYYYDDDYDNGTNSQLAEYDDYTMGNESTSVKITTHRNTSYVAQSKIESKAVSSETLTTEEKLNPDERILIGEAIVSVVTTKSVVNGTISIPTFAPMTTAQMDAPPVDATSPSPTDVPAVTTTDSIIVASVQTSRSISGARFLPFDLTGEPQPTNTSDETGTRKLPVESTESIIDKLDRVQSELSSGFLTGGFRTAGNALQLDVLSEQRPTPTRKSFTTTGRTPVISKFVPKRFNDRKTTIATSSTESTEAVANEEVTPQTSISSDRPKSNFRWPSRNKGTTESTRNTTRTTPKVKVEVQDISAFLPPGYKLKKEDEATERSILSDILAKSKINISSLLPANYKPKEIGTTSTTTTEAPKDPLQTLLSKSTVDISAFLPPGYAKNKTEDKKITATTTSSTSTTSSPIQKTLQELFSKSSVDISALLPAGYKDKEKKNETEAAATSTEAPSTTESTTKAGFIQLMFISRPGGRKASHKAVTPVVRANDAPTPVTPKIQKGWPTRATTEFTGWPTPSTTPISIEKLLEAARTATVSPANSSVAPITSQVSTTPSTTTTTTTVRPTTPGYCDDECEVAGTIRIIGNTTWVPELLDRNTNEWQELADKLEKEINLVYVKSAILRKWYKNVRIDAFSPGSILVDYFVELQDLTQRINTQELKVLFHDSLRTYNAHRWNETRTTKAPMRLGDFLIDPKSTDFVVIPKLSLPQHIEKDDRLIPQWAIAVIVIGVGGLLFIIVFGVSVLVNRQNTAKLRAPVPGMYTESTAKNIIQASQATTSHRSSQDYPKSEISTIWNETDGWRDKSFEENSNKILVDGMLQDEKKYNVYDSWRSEWNGYYYQPSHSGSKYHGYEGSAYSRHPTDYDTNF